MPDGLEPEPTSRPERPHVEGAAPPIAEGSRVAEPAGALAVLERALAAERAAREEAERLLRAARERVDDDLRVALDTCRQLDREKLDAFGLARPNDADLFEPGHPPVSLATFTWDRLREDLEARHRAELDGRDAQIRELAERHRRDLETLVDDRAGVLRQASERQSSLEAEVRRAEADRTEAATALASLTSALADARAELERAQNALAITRQRLDDVYASTSWKASRPLRGIARLLGNRGESQ